MAMPNARHPAHQERGARRSLGARQRQSMPNAVPPVTRLPWMDTIEEREAAYAAHQNSLPIEVSDMSNARRPPARGGMPLPFRGPDGSRSYRGGPAKAEFVPESNTDGAPQDDLSASPVTEADRRRIAHADEIRRHIDKRAAAIKAEMEAEGAALTEEEYLNEALYRAGIPVAEGQSMDDAIDAFAASRVDKALGERQAERDAFDEQAVEDQARMRADSEEGAAAKGKARRDAMASRRGVDPGEFPDIDTSTGLATVMPEDIRDLNRPEAQREAELDWRQGITDDAIRGYREGRTPFVEEDALRFADENGFRHDPNEPWTPPSSDYSHPEYYDGFRSQTDGVAVTPQDVQGMSDMDFLDRIMGKRGRINTQRGEIMSGPPITPEDIKSEREFMEFANMVPGSENQYKYNREGYDEFMRQKREGIGERAAADRQQYGEGSWDSLEQQANIDGEEGEIARQQMAARSAQNPYAAVSDEREQSFQDRKRAGRLAHAAAGPGANPAMVASMAAGAQGNAAELDRLRTMGDMQRLADRDRRRANVSTQAMLAGGSSFAPWRAQSYAFDQLPGDWRNVAMLDRATNGRANGPTPLGMQAQNMENAMRLAMPALNNAMTNMNPGGAAFDQRLAMAALTPEQRIWFERNGGLPGANGQPVIPGVPQGGAGPETSAKVGSIVQQYRDRWAYPSFDGRTRRDHAVDALAREANMAPAEAEALIDAERQRQGLDENMRPIAPATAPTAPGAPVAPPGYWDNERWK